MPVAQIVSRRPLMSLVPAAIEVLPAGFPTRRGPFAFCHAELLADPESNAADLEWLSRFDIIITNGRGIAPADTRRALQARGCHLWLYFWPNGFYVRDLGQPWVEGQWRDVIFSEHQDWLLSPETFDWPDYGIPMYVYDLGNPDLVDFLCRQMAERRARTGYDGTFFDYAGVWPLPPEARALWDQKHPDLPYDQALIGLFRRLRELDPGTLISTNQGYRSDEPLLAEVDCDMTESHGTSMFWGPQTEVNGETVAETFYRPWDEHGVAELYGDLEQRLRRAAPRRGFLYLDYMCAVYGPDGTVAQPLDLEAVYYSYCAAALWGREGFCSGWYAQAEYRGPLYFADLGRPLGDGPEVRDGIALREYERGLVALLTQLTPAETSYALRAPAGDGLYDLFAAETTDVCGGAATVRLSPGQYGLSGGSHPVGRVYLKV
jgi:hypothetical protein